MEVKNLFVLKKIQILKYTLMPQSSSQPLYCIKDFFVHRHTSVLGTDLLRNTHFPNCCTAQRDLCCDVNHEPAAEGPSEHQMLQPCTEAAGKGEGTSTPGDTCPSFPDAFLIPSPGKVAVVPPLSRHPGGCCISL